MDEKEKQNTPVKFLFRGWQEELSLAAADAIECCITSAYLNIAGVNLLQRVAFRLANLVSDSNKKPIKVLISENFAPTEKERKKILRNLIELPGVEVRVHRENRLMHWKNYIFKTDKNIRVVVGSVNSTSGGFFRNLECATLSFHKLDDPEALSIQKEFTQIWEKGIPATSINLKGDTMDIEPRFQVGDNVRIISNKKIGTINKILESKHSVAYRVTVDGKPTVYQQKYLETYIDEEQEIFKNLAMQNFEDAKAFHLFQTWFRLKKPIEGNIYSYLASRTIFNPYQFKPLSKFISPGSEERLFIADEVGVGKTIETGIILTELLS